MMCIKSGRGVSQSTRHHPLCRYAPFVSDGVWVPRPARRKSINNSKAPSALHQPHTSRSRINAVRALRHQPIVLGVLDEHNRRMIHRNVPELVRERQNVKAEYRRHNPLRYRAGHMILPATVRRIPFARILATKQNVRYDARHGDDHEEDGTEHGQTESQMGERQRHARHRMNVVRENGLQPEVDGAETETAECTDEVDHANVRLLEVADDAATEARADADPQAVPV